MTPAEERRALLEKASKKVFDELVDIQTQLKNFEPPKLNDDYDKIHMQMLFLTSTELELSYVYRAALDIKHEIEVSRARAKSVLDDAQMEAVNKPTFKTPHSYSSRPETEGKLRSLTFEQTYEVTHWDRLMTDAQYLLDVIKSYQMDVNKQRRDVDTRLKILSFKF